MTDGARHYRWDDLPQEHLTEKLDRRFISGERLMLAQIVLKKGCQVPRHSHENEQATYVLEGAMLFKLGANDEEERLLKTGEVLMIPSNLPHSAEAIEDSEATDMFSPRRDDWIAKSDQYLREAHR